MGAVTVAKDFVSGLFAPVLSKRGRAAAAVDHVRDLITPAVVQTKLRAMAAMFNHRPSLRHHLADVHPLGVPFSFDATMEFVTRDRQSGAHVVFAGGKMRVHAGPAARADTSLFFRDREAMRAFFGGADSFNMLLDNSLQIAGNFSNLLKFGHMSAVIDQGGRARAPRPTRHSTGWPADWRDLPLSPGGAPCPERPAGEVALLDDPYLADFSLDDLPRIKEQLWVFRTQRPAMCSERPRLLTEFVLAGRKNGAAADPPVLRQAKALGHMLAHKQAIIHADDLLAGTTTSKRVGVAVYPELGGVGMWPELLTMAARELNPYDIAQQDIEILDRQVFPFWMEDNVREWTKLHAADREPLELDERFVLYFQWKTQTITHTALDFPTMLARGLSALQADASAREAEAEDAKQRAFYQALQIALQGVLVYATHLAEEAERQLAQDGFDGPAGAARRAALERMAATCRKVPAQPAETLYEAIQAIWIAYTALQIESPNIAIVVGRLDTWLDPYLQRDVAGISEPAARRAATREALELTCALMMKLTDHLPMVPDVGNRLFGGSSSDQVITLGGVKPDGSDAVCDMTWLFLKATEMLRLRDPNVNARYAPGVNSEIYLRRLCEVNALAHATPALHNDDAVIPALVKQGFALEDARDWTATGCVEPTSCGRHFGHTNSMMFNLVAPLEMALNDGVLPVLGQQIGPRTGAAAGFETFDQFFGAFQQQFAWQIERACTANNMLGRAHQTLKPTPLMSSLFDGPLDKALDVTEGGAKYNTSGVALIGLTDVVDSLCAIEELVFRRKQVSMADLLRSLEADFEGHESLLAALMNQVPKFGQEDARPGAMARRLQDLAYDAFQSQPHYRGGRYLPGYWSMSNHVAFGLLSGALPSGRRKGKPFTPGLTPSHHTRSALTEQIRCVAELDCEKMPNSMAFNVKVVPGGADTPAAVVDRMAAYAGSYFDLGGMQMQFNVTSSQTMRTAMENPEEYADLLVRISGYNAYFVELNRDIQLELIERAEHCLGA